MENQLAIIAINNPDHKLKKPVGYHLDLTIVALLSGVCGMIGIPFLCGAPVRSIQHLQALSVFTKKDAPGEKPKLVKIHEQRVTGIVVNCLIRELLNTQLNLSIQSGPANCVYRVTTGIVINCLIKYILVYSDHLSTIVNCV